MSFSTVTSMDSSLNIFDVFCVLVITVPVISDISLIDFVFFFGLPSSISA